MKTLYKRDSKGKVRQWTVEIDGANYRTISGGTDSKQVISEWTTAKPTNEGKANERNGEQQAAFEVAAMYVKKIKEGYFEDEADIDECKLIKPMLAENHKDYKDELVFPVYVQPKLDGFRCVITPDGLFSRRGERFITCPHIADTMCALAAELGVIFDGELYNHSLKEDFNSLQSLITKKKPTEEDLAETKNILEYHVYDIIDTSLTFQERLIKLTKIMFDNAKKLKNVVFVETVHVTTPEELDMQYDKFMGEGYEGQMVRINDKYQNKRSRFLLKRKEFQDEEFPIAAIEEGIGNRSGMAGRVTLRLPDGREFGAGIKGGVKVNKELWSKKDALVGQLATIEFFNYTPDGIPRFPVFKTVRQDI